MPQRLRRRRDRQLRYVGALPAASELSMPEQGAGKDAASPARAMQVEQPGKSRRDSSVWPQAQYVF